MKTCIKCHEANLSALNFCANDGARLAENPRCKCGLQYLTTDKFCNNCGKPVHATLWAGEWIDQETAERIAKDGP